VPKDASDRASTFVLAIGTPTIGGAGETGQRRDGAVDQPHDLAQADLARVLEKIVAAVASPATSDQAGAPKVEEDLFEKAERDLLRCGDVARLQGFVRPATRQRNEGFEGVAGFLRQHEVVILAGVIPALARIVLNGSVKSLAMASTERAREVGAPGKSAGRQKKKTRSGLLPIAFTPKCLPSVGGGGTSVTTNGDCLLRTCPDEITSRKRGRGSCPASPAAAGSAAFPWEPQADRNPTC